MQSADNMKLGDRLAVSRRRSLESFLQRHRIGARRILLAAESAQPASRHAHVRRIDVAIHIEIGLIAVHPFTHIIGHPAYSQNVSGAIERESIVGVESLSSQHFAVNRSKPRIVSLKWMIMLRSWHPFDDIAGAGLSHKS